jgi:hypothetical protein
MTITVGTPKVLGPNEGLRLQSGPGRDLVFKRPRRDRGYLRTPRMTLLGPPLSAD